MKYSRLVKLLHNKYSFISYKELKYIVDEVFLFIKTSLKKGHRIEIRRFGIFEAKLYKAKNYFNPRTFEYKELSERLVPFYKASSILKRNINNKNI